ncbi:MAG TPA: hypothetical protein VL490_04215 [Mucilaginibacter sp.]|nr:hypothetical protein [Mucilaginibacter sp.]
MKNVLNEYKIQFSTPLNDPLYNKISTINWTLSAIIGLHYRFYDINALLSGIDSVLNDSKISKIEFETNGFQLAVVTKTITKMYENSSIYYDDETVLPDFSLSTQDFLVIVQAWYDYVANSSRKPLN